jgi:hypothetical protein
MHSEADNSEPTTTGFLDHAAPGTNQDRDYYPASSSSGGLSVMPFPNNYFLDRQAGVRLDAYAGNESRLLPACDWR